MTEYLFRSDELLNEVIDTAIEDNTFRSDDLEFTFAARVRISILTFVPRLLPIHAFDFVRISHLESPSLPVSPYHQIVSLANQKVCHRHGLIVCHSAILTLTKRDSKRSSNILHHAFQML